MLLIGKANSLFMDGEFDKAIIVYQEIVDEYKINQYSTHRLIYEYAKKQVTQLTLLSKYKFKARKNIIITSVNSKYFQTLLTLVQSIKNISNEIVDLVVVFDFGLDQWQIDIIEKIKKVKLFKVDDSINDNRLERFSINDTNTYFFKVYALHYWHKILKYDAENVNLLWIDSGIKIEKNLINIFRIIDSEECFFVDHSDVEHYYKDPQNYLVNILSSKIIDKNRHYKELSDEELLTPYIKANFFGIKLSGKYDYLLEEHLDICLDTNILYEPRNVTNKEEQNYWIKNTSILETIKLKNLKNSGKYLNGRHEQTVWTYLIAKEHIKIYNSSKFNFTVSPGSGTQTKTSWEKKCKQLLNNDYFKYKSFILNFMKKMGIDKNEINKYENNKEAAIEKYLKIGKSIYFDNKFFLSPGFPIPREAEFSTVFLHRGSLSRIDEEKYIGTLLNSAKNIKEEPFILLGNGPSLANVDFKLLKGKDTMGLNAAYRAYDKIDFWPKYFGCFDGLVCKDHSSEFKKLIRNSPIEKFFFINIDEQGNDIFPEDDIKNSKKFQNIDFNYRNESEKLKLDILSTTFKPFMDMRTSGPNSILTALILGYRKIIMLGVDQNYIEVVDGATKNGNYHKLIMEKTPDKNPNYWFDDYQVKGDKFNRPNLQGSQISSWDNLSRTLENLNIKVEIYNCSPISNLKSYKKASLSFALKKFNKLKSNELPCFKSPLD